MEDSVGEQNEIKRRKLKSKECHAVGEQNENKRRKLKSKESLVVGEQNENRRGKLRSKVWAEITKREIDGKQWAICNHCGRKFDGSSKKGTKHLKNHLQSKICRATRKGRDGNEDKSIMRIKEKSSVIDFIKSSSDPRDLNSRKAEILQFYQEEMKSLSKLSCRFSLEFVEFRYCDPCLLIVHYIDGSWEQQRKVIGQCDLSDESLIEAMKRVCSEWKIDRNICSVLDRCLKLVERSWFSQQGSLPFAGSVPYLRGLVNDLYWLANSWETVKIDGLRRCVHYAYHTSNKIKLQSAVNNAKTMGKKVIFSDGINLIYCGPDDYLEIAVGLKEAFSELEKIDPHFRNLTKVQWDEATVTFEHLKALQEFVSDFYSDDYKPKIKDILKLVRCNRSENCHVCKYASHHIKKNVSQYWSKYYLILDTLVILDSRFKIKAVQRLYEEIYSSDADGYLEKTVKCFRDIYDEYAIAGDANSSKSYKMLDAMGRPCTSSPKSELDVYLDELAVEEFDILAWWRGNAVFYPTLAMMARDFLAISISPSYNSFLEEIENWEFEIDNEILPAVINFKYGCN